MEEEERGGEKQGKRGRKSCGEARRQKNHLRKPPAKPVTIYEASARLRFCLCNDCFPREAIQNREQILNCLSFAALF